MNQSERNALIEKIIMSQHKGMNARPDYLVYNDKKNWLSKLSDEQLLEEAGISVNQNLN